jgi:hypothetical protein
VTIKAQGSEDECGRMLVGGKAVEVTKCEGDGVEGDDGGDTGAPAGAEWVAWKGEAGAGEA